MLSIKTPQWHEFNFRDLSCFNLNNDGVIDKFALTINSIEVFNDLKK